MKIVSINVRGTGDSGKKGWIRSIIRDEKPDVIGLQGTKSGTIDDLWIEGIWGGGAKVMDFPKCLLSGIQGV